MESSIGKEMTEDIWRCIFEKLIDAEQRPSVILPLLCVCSEWKAIAQPLLHRYLFFENTAAVARCHQNLLWSAINGSFPGKASRSFLLSSNCTAPTSESSMGIDRMLHYTPNLRAFHSRFQLSSNVLETLAHVSGHCLRDLGIVVGGEGTNGAIQLALLARFSALKELSLHMRGLGDISQLFAREAIGFEMHSLESLVLRGFTNESQVTFLAYMSHCRFPLLTALGFNFFAFGTTTPCEAALSLFSNIGPQLLELSLRLPNADDAPQLLFPLLTKLRRLSVVDKPPQGTFRFLPATVAKLQLCAILSTQEQAQALVHSLDLLSTKSADQHSVTAVVITWGGGSERFLWRTIGAKMSLLAGELMIRSVLLASKGIRVEDEDGKWVGELSWRRRLV